MRNLLFLIGLSLLTTLFLGCEQEDFAPSDNEPAISAEVTNLDELKETPKTSIPNEKTLELTGVPTFEEIVDYANKGKDDPAAEVSLRTGDPEPLIHVPELQCGDVVNGDNFYSGNNYTGGLYQRGCLGRFYPFDANDVEYIFSLDQTESLQLDLTRMSDDLDLFIFSLDHRFFPLRCLDKSVNSGSRNEAISITLPRGTYAILIDGWRSNIESQFTLSLTCERDDCEDFDRLPEGDLTQLSSNWVKWDNRSYLDAQVSSRQAYSRPNSVWIRTIDNNEPDVTRLFGERTHGKYKVSWKMYVPRGSNATFNVKKYSDPRRETAVATYLKSDGGIAFRAKGRITQSYQRYSQDYWMDVEMYLDLDRETTILYIDHAPVAKWSTRIVREHPHRSVNRFAGINFWAYHSFTNFYVDDVCFEQNPPNMPDYEYTPATEL